MSSFLDLLERIAPRLPYYPRWAQRLFFTAFASVLASVLVYAVASPSAAENRLLKDIGFGVSLGGPFQPPSQTAAAGSTFDEPLQYGESSGGGMLRIVPKVPYADRVDAGGPIAGMFEYTQWDSALELPKLDLALTNNTSRTIYFDQAVFDVSRSVLDPRPIPVVIDDPSNVRHVLLKNEGWGPMKDLSLRFDLLDPGGTGSGAGSYARVVHVGTVGEEKNVDLSRAIAAYGVDLAAIKRLEAHFPGGRPTAAQIPVLRRALRPFRARTVRLVGELDYTASLVGGGNAARRVKLSTHVTLVTPPAVVGAAAPSSATYNVAFEIGKSRYKEIVPLHQYLRPGDQDRFQIVMTAPRSSRHDFRLRLVTNDGHVVAAAQPIEVTIFVPRSRVSPPQKGKVALVSRRKG